MHVLKQLHFWLGLTGIIIFLLTGQYMFRVLDVLQGMDDGPRMLFRSAHIYFLLVSIINLVIGFYLQPANLKLNKWIQYIISIVFLLTPFVILAGFFLEPFLGDLYRPYVKPALYSLFAVAVLLIIAGLKDRLGNYLHRTK